MKITGRIILYNENTGRILSNLDNRIFNDVWLR